MKDWEFAFTGTWPPMAIILVASVAGLLAWATYRAKRLKVPFRVYVLLNILRVAAIVVAALFLLKPVIRYSRTQTEQTQVLMLVDVSRSMSIRDAADNQTRIDAGIQILKEQPYALLERIGKTQKIRMYTFGAYIAEVGQDAPFKAEQEATAIGEALKETISSIGEQGLCGVVLLSDGVNTIGEDPTKVSRYLGVPVHTVALGGKQGTGSKFHDIGITSSGQNLEFIVKNKAKVDARISSYGMDGFTSAERTVTLTLKSGEETLATQEVQLPSENATTEATVEWTPAKVGMQKLMLSVPVLTGETVTENNVRHLTVRVIDPKIRVLVVEGVARMEYKFLRHVLESDPNIDFSSVVKLRKDRFYVQGVDPGIDLSRGLPTRLEDYEEKFDVVILGDIARDEFSAAQLQNLRDFISKKGKGLFVMGGYHAFGAGGWGATDLADMLPVKMGSVAGQIEGKFTPRLTHAGRDHTVFEGCAEFFGEGPQQVSLDGANRVAGAKPGAEVLLVHPTEQAEGEPMPVVAVQRYGGGMVLAFTGDTTWKWKFQVEGRGLDSPYYRFWRQAVRWLAGRKGEGFEGEELLLAWPNKVEYEAGETVILEAKVRGRDKQPNDNATVEAQIHYPVPIQKVNPRGEKFMETQTTGKLQHIPLSMGQYQIPFRPPTSGIFRTVVTASDASGTLGQAEFDFVVGRATTEFDRVDIDELTLQEISGQTRGKYYTFATAKDIPDQLEKSRRRIIYHEELTLWNAPGFFLIFLICVAAEWFLRKRFALS